MLIALASLNQTWEDKVENLLSCEVLFHKARKNNAQLIIFPEMTLTGFSMNTNLIAEDSKKSPTVESFKSLAKKFEMGVIFGVVFKHGKKAVNKSIFLNTSGQILGEYTKIHPFSFSGEDALFDAGKEIIVVKFEFIRIGLTICYDLRFPEIYSAIGKKSDLIVNIANWPARRIKHWSILLKARAIENQVFVAGVNRTGTDVNENFFTKSSAMVSPDGKVLKPIYSEENIEIFEVDIDYLREYKSKFSTTQDRKPEFYKRAL